MIGTKVAGSCEAVRESHSGAILNRLGLLGEQLDVVIGKINTAVADVTTCSERPLAEEVDKKDRRPLPPLFTLLHDKADTIEMQVARLTDLLDRLEL